MDGKDDHPRIYHNSLKCIYKNLVDLHLYLNGLVIKSKCSCMQIIPLIFFVYENFVHLCKLKCMFSLYFDLGITDKYFIANVHDATPKNLKRIPNLFCHFFFWCLKKKSMLNFIKILYILLVFRIFFTIT
jgi:hypothetical protein